MATVFIPPLLRSLTGGVDTVEVVAERVDAAVRELDGTYPGIAARLLDDEGFRPGLSVVVDGKVSPLGGLQHLREDSEVHFLPAIGGG